MANYPTPHINAKPGDFAKTVLMPGDPLRSAFVAKEFLEGAVLVNNVRGVQGYTGTYKGEKVSVMASGMGIPSIGIYSHELYNVFDVENIIRIGSIGGLAEKVKLRDVIIGISASTDSAFADQFGFPGRIAPTADFDLVSIAVEEAKKLGASYHVGNIVSADSFYNHTPNVNEKWRDMGALGVEMEAAGLYLTAAAAKKRALAICTVSDHIFTGEALSANERQTSFTEMMEIALGTAIRL